MKALEAKVAQDGGVLTESQFVALEKAKADIETDGKFESEHSGYCLAQDTFYVGTLKGVELAMRRRRGDVLQDLHAAPSEHRRR